MTAEALNIEAPEIIVRPMLTMNKAIDLYAGDLARRGCSERTRYTYTRILGLFANRLPDSIDVSKITSDDCRRFLDLYNGRAAGTKVHTYTVLSSFFKWLMMTEQARRSPMTPIPRPRRKRTEDLDVTTVTGDDVRKLLKAGQTWTERLAVAIPVYLGPRRRAVAQLRYSYDGWALSTSAKALRDILPFCPPEHRVLAWVKHTVTVSWEPVIADVPEVVLTPEQADAICETLIEMAVMLPMKHRNHYDALVMLGWEPYGSD